MDTSLYPRFSEAEFARGHGGAVSLTDAAVENLVAHVKPGMREYRLGALVEAVGLANGGLPLLYYISTGAIPGRRTGRSSCRRSRTW